MTETMIERVARVLEPQAWAALGTGDTLAYLNRRKSSLRKARAAIEAMREPTPHMVTQTVTFMQSVVLGGEYRWSNYARDVHCCNVDAALNEDQTK